MIFLHAHPSGDPTSSQTDLDMTRRIYDAYAGAYKVIHRNIKEALKATGIVDGEDTLNRNAKSAALSAFEGAKQGFFGHLLVAMKCPSLIRAIEVDLGSGRSAVIKLLSTGEALMERRIAEIPASEWDSLLVDLIPLQIRNHLFCNGITDNIFPEPSQPGLIGHGRSPCERRKITGRYQCVASCASGKWAIRRWRGE